VLKSLPFILTVLLLMVILSIGLLAATPPISRDALTHHLAVPKLYLEAGGMVEMPDIPFSYYPMNLDMLYILPLYFGNDILPKYIHFLFGLLTAWGIGSYLKERFDIRYGLMGALLFLSTPIIVKLASTVYVDLGLCCFAFFSLYYLLKWAKNNFRLKYLLISGGMCGLALGTKYNALVVFLILTFMVPWLHIRYADSMNERFAGGDRERQNPKRQHPVRRTLISPIVNTGVFVIAALLLFAPWMIRNVYWTGNPIYPLYDHLFTTVDQSPPQDSTEILQYNASNKLPPLVRRRLVYKEPLWYIALIPFRIFIEGRDDDPGHFDGKLNPFFLLLSIVPFLKWRQRDRIKRRDDSVWLLFSVLLLLFTFFISPIRIRYLIAMVPPVIILSLSGMHCLARSNTPVNNAARSRPIVWPIFTAMIFVAALVYNSIYIQSLYKHYKPLTFLTGEVSRDQYIATYRPEYVLYLFANHNLTKKDKILELYLGNRSYYSDIPMITSAAQFWNAVHEADAFEDITTRLTAEGITHLMIRRDLFQFSAMNKLNSEKKRVLQNFIDTALVKLKDYKGYSLYKIISSSG
jgi:4-amino-4-deoxy-L-arabinose transferase-like glycosyltransferase